MNNLLIIGAGQFGQVTKEIAESLEIFNKIDFLDDNSDKAIGKIGEYEKFQSEYNRAIVAIGNAEIRKKLLDRIEKIYSIESIISQLAYVSKSSKIEEGTIIEPTAFINANTDIGKGCIICAGSIINHNAKIGNYCHINCGSIVKSNSIIVDGKKIDYGEIL